MVAHLVEQQTYNLRVAGSNPAQFALLMQMTKVISNERRLQPSINYCWFISAKNKRIFKHFATVLLFAVLPISKSHTNDDLNSDKNRHYGKTIHKGVNLLKSLCNDLLSSTTPQ